VYLAGLVLLGGAVNMSEQVSKKGEAKRFYRKRIDLFRLIEKIKLWPSRKGVLHGVRSIDRTGDLALIITHCGERILITNSRNSRAARWLRNKWYLKECEACRIPEWKKTKFSLTQFKRHYGSLLLKIEEDERS
jgi:pyrrolysyl-tRNA synthetase-like protein